MARTTRSAGSSSSARTCVAHSRRRASLCPSATIARARTRTVMTPWSGLPLSRGRTATSAWWTARTPASPSTPSPRPPHLRALSPREGGGDLYNDWVFRAGANQLSFTRSWTMQTSRSWLSHPTAAARYPGAHERLEQALSGGLDQWFAQLPLNECPPLQDLPLVSWYFDHLGHPDDGPFWDTLRMGTRYDEVDVPMLHIGGWFDFFLGGTLRMFQGVQAHARTEAARRAQRLVVGPWAHGPDTNQSLAGELAFGPEAMFDIRAQRVRWYDYWLKGEANGIMDGPPVRAFLMGANRWLELDSWPPVGVTYRPAYFHR